VSTADRSAAIRDVLAAVSSTVRLIFFEQPIGCDACTPTRQLLEQLADLSPYITLETVNLILEKDRALRYGVRMTASGKSGLSDASRARLAALGTPVRLQVFFTPTCASCPQTVNLANRLAIESPRITATAIDATEYPDLVRRYNVNGVPKTMINDAVEILGAASEADLVKAVLKLAAD
jgi:hypothetical protein